MNDIATIQDAARSDLLAVIASQEILIRALKECSDTGQDYSSTLEAQIEGLEAQIEGLERSLLNLASHSDAQQLLIGRYQKALDGFESMHREMLIGMCVSEAVKPSAEKALETHFYDHLASYVPEGVKVKVGYRDSLYPDGFVSVKGVISPVECKKGVFDRNAREQLLKYMEVYNMPHGFAVAHTLHERERACLPKNITFIPVDAPLFRSDMVEKENASRDTFTKLINSFRQFSSNK